MNQLITIPLSFEHRHALLDMTTSYLRRAAQQTGGSDVIADLDQPIFTVVTGEEPVSGEIDLTLSRERWEEISWELGYVPTRGARNLQRRIFARLQRAPDNIVWLAP